jgi:hypothetical protein
MCAIYGTIKKWQKEIQKVTHERKYISDNATGVKLVIAIKATHRSVK